MRNRFQVVAVSAGGVRGGEIKVVPLISDACINCEKSMCAKRGKAFSVGNPREFPVKTGDVVSISAAPLAQAVQAAFALLFPVAAAVLGFVLIPGSEAFRAMCMTGCFLAAGAVVFCVTHLLPPVKSEIAGIL